MEYKKRKKWPIVLVCLLIVTVLAAIPLLQNGPYIASAESTLETATVETGEISSTVVGTGNLRSTEAQEIKLPGTLKYDKVYVESGDRVEAGDVLATINASHLESTIAQLRKSIADTDVQLAAAIEDDESSIIRTYVSGRVKRISVEEGESVLDAMGDEGSLLLLSLDGKMAVDILTDAELSVNDEVRVILSDEREKKGRVRRIGGGKCTVTLTDDGPKLGEEVTVKDEDGDVLGAGFLYIHQPLEIVGYTGTVKTLHVKENEKVDEEEKLLTLEDAPYSYDYQDLLMNRADMVEDLHTYLKLSNSLVVEAPVGGTIDAVNITAEAEKTSAQSAQSGATAEMTPDDMSAAALAAAQQTMWNSPWVVKRLASARGEEASPPEEAAPQEEEPSPEESLPEEPTPEEEPSEEPQTEEPSEPEPTEEPAFEDIKNIKGLQITAPKTGETPQETLEEQAKYVGALLWYPSDAVFAADTVYTAYVALQAKPGYAFPASFQPSMDGAAVSYVSVGDYGESNTLSFALTYPATQGDGGSAPPTGEAPATENPGGEMPDGQTPDVQVPDVQIPNMDDYSNLGNYDLSGYGSFSMPSADTSALQGGALSSTGSTANANTATNIVAFTMAADEEAKLPVNIDELDILNIHVGQQATVVFDALPEESFTGEITKISDSASASGGVAKYSVEITLQKSDSMRSGMNASATILIDRKEGVLLLPMEALQERGGMAYVYTSRDEETKEASGMQEVTTGASDGIHVEILSGLSEGDTVYYEPAAKVMTPMEMMMQSAGNRGGGSSNGND